MEALFTIADAMNINDLDDTAITQLALTLAAGLNECQLKLACAESCTGGWIAKSLTDLSGSSRWFDCAVVSYSNQAKINLLGVSAQTLDTHGAVSQPVVKEMVLGLLDRCDADYGIAVSGIAGPGGGSTEKPVGTVWLAWGRPGVLIEAMRFKFDGDREQVRRQAVVAGIQGVLRLINQQADDSGS